MPKDEIARATARIQIRRAFRHAHAGAREGYSDGEIDAIASWFSMQKPAP
jgi:hypothetical protein